MKRPVVLTILAILAIIGGALSLLIGVLGIFVTGLLAAGAAAGTSGAGTATAAAGIGTVYLIVAGILYLAFGIGTFMSKGWGWTAGVIALAWAILDDIVSVVVSGFNAGTIVSSVIGLIIALVLVWYLFRPNVRGSYGMAAA